MPGDYSRETFDRHKHYSGVRMQQGRVQLDADWNEQLAIQQHRTHIETIDVIGACGVPKLDDGFHIGPALGDTDLTIAPGRIYVNGLLCELEAGATYTTQPDYPNPDFTGPLTSPLTSPLGGLGLTLSDGVYLVYLDTWQREITALDDPRLREVALGGPDTTTRLKTVWQVRLLPVNPSESEKVSCQTAFPEWDSLITPNTGKLNARTKINTPPEDPCLLPPQSGYRRLENQLYRVEIHTGGNRGGATFKWSRDNATVETTITKIDGAVLTVADLGKDEVLGFAGGQWVEVIDEEVTLKGTPHALIQIKTIYPETHEVELMTSVAALAGRAGLKLRRWDQTGATANGIAMTSDWLDVEGGIQVFFADGNYRAGDYWLIPARTATGEIEWPPFAVPNTAPLLQPPLGVQHHYCRLALLTVKNGALTLEDCREEFPSLTEICAEDICFDNSVCQLPETETVQDALERLCAARDLRHHNKHLHGWGIVCGLQVVCGPHEERNIRRTVTVRSGYAIDCEGNDIITESDENVDLLKLIDEQLPPPASPPTSPPTTGIADGEVCLLLELDAERGLRYRVERYDAASANTWQSILSGTLLLDFYNDCIKRIQDFLQDELTPPQGEENLPAGPVQQRISALTNLATQTVNPQAGQHIYISPREHVILRDFYSRLRALLQSETFCAMFDNARPFPDYPLADLDMDTIFGKGAHGRLRLRPNAQEAYSVGPGLNPLAPATTINRFDLRRRVLVDQIDPIAGATITNTTSGNTGVGAVQDVAFSLDGRLIYMIASTRDDQDTLFRIGEISERTITWRPLVTICGVKLVTLATTVADRRNVYAIGLKKVTIGEGSNQKTEIRGAGLYQINPDSVNPNMNPLVPFNAHGHLEILTDGRAFATAAGENVQPTTYDRVKVLQLPAGTQIRDVGLGASGSDDIAVISRAPGVDRELLYSVVGPDGQGNKEIRVHDIASGAPITGAAGGPGSILLENTTIRVEPHPATRTLLVTLEDSYRVRMVDLNTQRLVAEYMLPTQVGPTALAVDVPSRRVYVLNYASNTISTVSADLFRPDFRFPLATLAAYRKAALEAFTDLLAGFLQYLKDCLCDHFLVKCPECTEEDKLYLACISIRDGQVYKVCNFSKRRYVKSFPTVDYWLSLVPVIPLLSRWIEQFCCSVLPDLFRRYTVPDFDEQRSQNPEVNLKVGTVREGVTMTQQADLFALGREFFNRGQILGSVARDAMLHQPTPLRMRAGDPALAAGNLVDQPAERVAGVLREKGIAVELVPYDPASQPDLITSLAGVLRTPAPGGKVTLYEEGGRVRYYSVAARTETTETDRLRGEVENLRAELTRVQQTHREEIAARDRELTTLRGSLDAMRSDLSTLGELRRQVAELMRRR